MLSKFDDQKNLVLIPEDYLCPIYQTVMKNPVVAADGHTYEEEAILAWLQRGKRISPLTGEKLSHTTLIPNYKLKTIIQDFMQQLPEIQKQNSVRVNLQDALKQREEFIDDLLQKHHLKINALSNDNQKLTNQLNSLYKENSQYNQEIDYMKQMIIAKNVEVDSFKQKLSQNESEIDILKQDKLRSNEQLTLLAKENQNITNQLKFSVEETEKMQQISIQKDTEITYLRNKYFEFQQVLQDNQKFLMEKFTELLPMQKNQIIGANAFLKNNALFFSQNSKPLLNLSSVKVDDHGNWAIRMKRLPDGKTVCCFGDGTFKIFNLRDGKVVKTVREAHVGRIWDCDVFQNKYLITCAQDKSIKFWDNLGQGACIKTLKYERDVLSVCALSEDKIATGSVDSKITIWSFSTGKQIKTITGHKDGVQSLVYIPEKNLLLSSSSDALIYVWSLEPFKELHKLTGHKKLIFDLRRLSDNYIISSSDDYTAKIWDPNSGKCIMTLTGHEHFVNGASQLSNGNIVTSSEDKTIKIWDNKTGSCLRTIACHESPVWAMETCSLNDNEVTILSGDTKGNLFFNQVQMPLKQENIHQGKKLL